MNSSAHDPNAFHHLWSQVLIYVLALTAVSVVGFPLFWMVISSLKAPGELYALPPTMLPKAFSLANYVALFTQTRFADYFVNSLIVAGGTTVVSLTIGGLAGYTLGRFNFFGLTAFGIASLFCYMLPETLIVIPLYVLAVNLGLANSLFGLILANTAFSLPLVIWFMRSYFMTVPVTFEESAMIDGCSRLKAFWRITLPMALPGFVSVGMLCFNNAWNEYLLSLVLISSDRNKTLPLGLATWIGTDSLYSWGMLLAGAVLLTGFSIIIYLFAQNSLTSGLTHGGTKE